MKASTTALLALLATLPFGWLACSDNDSLPPGDEPKDPPPKPGDPPGPPKALELEQVPYPTGLSYVTDMRFLPEPNDEFLAIDLNGGVEHARLTDSGAEVLLEFGFDDVYAEYDAGQLGLAVDPDFADNRYFYIAANLAKNHVVVRRYELVEGDAQATEDSEQLILELEVSSSPRWHNISAMGFDEDGVMWMLVGDKGLFDPAQDPTDIMGTLIQVVPNKEPGEGGYTIPDGAALYSPDADPAVHSIGIRSPWKGIYHEGKWYFGDVGLDTIEEVNVISEPGQNFGWPVVEGNCDDDVLMTDPDCSLYDDPWLSFGRSNSSAYVQDDIDAVPTNKRSVYAGWIRQPTSPDPYDGRMDDLLLFGDAFVGFLRAQPIDAEDDESFHLAHLEFPSAWGQGPDGYVYVMALSEEPETDDPGSGLPSPLNRILIKE